MERGLPPNLEVLEICTRYKESTEYKNSKEKYQDLIKHQDVWINRLICHFFKIEKPLKEGLLKRIRIKVDWQKNI